MLLEDRITYSALVVVAVWIATRIYEFIATQFQQKSEKERFVRALFAEIDLNTADMEEFIEKSASLSTVKAKIREDKEFIPHITDNRLKDIYKSKIDLIHHAGDNYIADVVGFYGMMERITREIEGVYLPSYNLISADGRCACIDEIWNFALEGARLGRSILADMADTYPVYQLRRKSKTATDVPSIAELRVRSERLRSDLDRARSSHNLSS